MTARHFMRAVLIFTFWRTAGMEGIPLREKYGKYFSLMSQLSKAAPKIDATKVYEEANPELRRIMYSMLEELMLPDSHLGNIENFKAFYDGLMAGKSSLILMEHFGNLDLPDLMYQLEKYPEPWAKELSSRIVAIAGLKLNEDNPMVRAWAEAFTRVIIYPSRGLNSVEKSNISDAEKEAEEKRSRAINLAAMHAMDDCKKRGQAILVFPAGTRYRPGKPETRRGLREIDSYLRMFDQMILVSINGNCLRLNPANTEDMLADLVFKDTIIQTASKVYDCKQFRKEVLASLPADCPDPKQVVADRIMDILIAQHDAIDPRT